MAKRPRSYPEPVERLIESFGRMPGIGKRTATRLALHVLKDTEQEVREFSAALLDVKERVSCCSICWQLTEVDPCPICSSPSRDASTVLVVEQPRDLISLEQTGMHGGVYHVLLGRLDPLDGVGPEGLTVDDLLAHKGHSNEKLEEVDELLQHGAKISQQTTYIGGEKTLGEVEGVKEYGVKIERLQASPSPSP